MPPESSIVLLYRQKGAGTGGEEYLEHAFEEPGERKKSGRKRHVRASFRDKIRDGLVKGFQEKKKRLGEGDWGERGGVRLLVALPSGQGDYTILWRRSWWGGGSLETVSLLSGGRRWEGRKRGDCPLRRR